MSPPTARRQYRPESPVELAILELMADGRPRTTTEIAERVGARANWAYRLLRRHQAAGVFSRLTRGSTAAAAIWQEAPE